jgi:hypothetical protein
MKQSKNKDPEIVLLNSEGPVLKAKGSDDGSYVLYDTDDSIVKILDLDGFIGFIFSNRPVKYTDGREFIFSKFSAGMRTKKSDIIRFIILSEKNSSGLDTWMSPIAEEKEWQEDVLKELFPSYPNSAPKWQYMNGLLQIALRYKEQIEIDHGNSSGYEELEDDENG